MLASPLWHLHLELRVKPLKEAWNRCHLGKKSLDLKVGYLDRSTYRFYRYAGIHPNLVLLGAQKCGTSSLAHYLSFHPDIHVSSPLKEPGFYIFDNWAKDYWESKGRVFGSRASLLRKGMLAGYSGQRYLLDATTRYTVGTSARELDIPARMSPFAQKCIYIIRNPFERMISSYNSFYRGKVPENFNKRFAVDSSILETSLYFKQLLPYAQAIGKENILVLVFEEFFQDVANALYKVCDFLEVERCLPFAKFPAINASPARESYQFSDAVFQQLEPRVRADMELMQTYLGRPLSWDLSAERWVGCGTEKGNCIPLSETSCERS